MNDKISVCMATYNGSRFILFQIESILSQLREYDELIISDDGSTDGTLALINELNDKRIKVFSHHKKPTPLQIAQNNFFVTNNFENALNHATGEYIFLSDQDDIWMPNKVEKTMQVLNKIHSALTMSTIDVIDSDGNVFQRNPNIKKMSFWEGLKKAKYLGCTMAFDRSFLNEILPFPKYAVSHDAWIGLLANYQNRIYTIDERLIQYRRHGSNVTAKISNPLWFKILYRAYYLFAVIKRTYSKNLFSLVKNLYVKKMEPNNDKI